MCTRVPLSRGRHLQFRRSEAEIAELETNNAEIAALAEIVVQGLSQSKVTPLCDVVPSAVQQSGEQLEAIRESVANRQKITC